MSKKILIISDGKLGHEKQAIRIANKLGASYEVMTPERRSLAKFWAMFNPLWVTTEYAALVEKAKDFDIAMGVGTVARLSMLGLKKIQPELKIVCLSDPKANYADFDVAAVPTHDVVKYEGDNLVRFTGSLSYYSEEELEETKVEFKEEFKKYYTIKPIIGLIIGGNSRGYDFTMRKAEEIINTAERLALRLNAFIYATTSRRTGVPQKEMIKHELGRKDFKVYIGEEDVKNPYKAILAYSDIIIITPETVSMLAEACASKALVLVYDIKGLKSGRIRSFVEDMVAQEKAYCYTDIIHLGFESLLHQAKKKSYPQELEKVAAFIKEKTL